MLVLEAHNFTTGILSTNKVTVVSFVDGFDCSSCKTAKTNMLPLPTFNQFTQPEQQATISIYKFFLATKSTYI